MTCRARAAATSQIESGDRSKMERGLERAREPAEAPLAVALRRNRTSERMRDRDAPTAMYATVTRSSARNPKHEQAREDWDKDQREDERSANTSRDNRVVYNETGRTEHQSMNAYARTNPVWNERTACRASGRQRSRFAHGAVEDVRIELRVPKNLPRRCTGFTNDELRSSRPSNNRRCVRIAGICTRLAAQPRDGVALAPRPVA